MFCPECGYENNNENKFCMRCGKDIKQEAKAFRKDNLNGILEDKTHEKEINIPDKTNENEPGVCTECGYHNSLQSYKCIRCDKILKEDSQITKTDNNQTFQNTSNMQYNANQYHNDSNTYTTDNISSATHSNEQHNYEIFSENYNGNYEYKMLKPSLAASIGGAILVILAYFMSFMNIDLTLLKMFSDDIPQSYSASLIDIEPYGILVMLFMILLIILLILKRQKASIAPLISSIILFCDPLIDIYSGFNDDDTDMIFAKNIAESMYEFGAGFYFTIIGFIIIGIGIFLAYRDNWDKTTRTMHYVVDGIMAVIVVIAVWVGYDTVDPDSLEGFVDYPESYRCEMSLGYDMNETL